MPTLGVDFPCIIMRPRILGREIRYMIDQSSSASVVGVVPAEPEIATREIFIRGEPEKQFKDVDEGDSHIFMLSTRVEA